MKCQRILVIEDDTAIRETLKEVLELEGYAVVTAENGEAGLRVLEAVQRPCLIFLDLMMPVMDGWQFLEALKAHPDSVLSSIPVTVVSAAAEAVEISSRHQVHVLKKPTDIDHFLKIAMEYCGSPR